MGRSMGEGLMNEGRWILVHRGDNGIKLAINLDHVVDVADTKDGAWIDFSTGDGMRTRESFDEIGAMIR